jgi:hypothetical protein
VRGEPLGGSAEALVDELEDTLDRPRGRRVRLRIVSRELGAVGAGAGQPREDRVDPFARREVVRDDHAPIDSDRVQCERDHDAGAVLAGRSEHTIRNESEDEERAFVVFSPGAEMERFARVAGALAAARQPTIEDIMALAHAHGIEITRPLGRAG